MEDDLLAGGGRNQVRSHFKGHGLWTINPSLNSGIGIYLPRVSPLAFPISGPCLSFTSKMGTGNGAVLMGQGTVLCQAPSYS